MMPGFKWRKMTGARLWLVVDRRDERGGWKTYDDERLPRDVGKGGRDEEADGKVEQPVGHGGQGHARRPRLQRPDLGRIDPGDGGQRQRVDDDQQVGEGDDGVCRAARDADDDVGVPTHAARDGLAVGTQHAADDEMADSHAHGAVDEERPATGLVDEEEDGGGEDDEEGVLHARRDEVDVPGEAGHLEDVDDVVGHDVGAAELLPRLHRHTGDGAAPHAVEEELAPPLGRLGLGGQDGGDLLELGDDERVLGVAVRVDAGQDADGLVAAADLGQPARRARQEGDAQHEDEGGHKLDAPGGAEAGGAADEGAAVADEEHDEDTPLDGQLLDDDQRAALLLACNLREVDGHLRRGDADADAVEHTTGDELAVLLAGDLDGGADEPEEAGHEDGVATAEAVGQRTGEERTDDGATGEGGPDGALSDAGGVVEVGDILFRAWAWCQSLV